MFIFVARTRCKYSVRAPDFYACFIADNFSGPRKRSGYDVCVCVCVSVFELNDIDFVRSSILQCTYVIGALQVHVLNKCLPPLG